MRLAQRDYVEAAQTETWTTKEPGRARRLRADTSAHQGDNPVQENRQQLHRWRPRGPTARLRLRIQRTKEGPREASKSGSAGHPSPDVMDMIRVSEEGRKERAMVVKFALEPGLRAVLASLLRVRRARSICPARCARCQGRR